MPNILNLEVHPIHNAMATFTSTRVQIPSEHCYCQLPCDYHTNELKIMHVLIRQIWTKNHLLLLEFFCVHQTQTYQFGDSFHWISWAALQLNSLDLKKSIRPWRSPHLHPASDGSIEPTSSKNQARSKREQHLGDQRRHL